MKDWQQGHDIETLKGYAKPFKDTHGPHIYGRFGLVNERDVADALMKDRYVCVKDDVGVVAACIYTIVERQSVRKDFRGEPIVIPKGATFLTAFAAYDRFSGAALLNKMKRFGKGWLWAEIFEEDRATKRAMLSLGANWRGTKISADSSLKGIYAAPDPQPGFDLWTPTSRYHEVSLPWAEAVSVDTIDRSFITDAELENIRQELDGRDLYAQHYSSYNVKKTWTAFSLRGYDPTDPSFIIKPSEMSKGWKAENPERLDASCLWTEASLKFPTALKVVRRIVGDDDALLDRVRFMKLEAENGELSRHADITDRDAGVADGKIARLHIPIRTSDKVRVYGWSARGSKSMVRFAEKSLCYLDQRKPHRVVNKSGQDRIHLVADVHSGQYLRDMLNAIRGDLRNS